MTIFGIITLIVLLKNGDSKHYNNVTSIDRSRHLSAIDNNAFPWPASLMNYHEFANKRPWSFFMLALNRLGYQYTILLLIFFALNKKILHLENNAWTKMFSKNIILHFLAMLSLHIWNRDLLLFKEKFMSPVSQYFILSNSE